MEGLRVSSKLHKNHQPNGSQLAITCSMLTIETLELGVECVKVNNKDTITTLLASFWCLYC